MDSVRSGPFGQIFRPDNFVFGQSGAGENFLFISIRKNEKKIYFSRKIMQLQVKLWVNSTNASYVRSERIFNTSNVS